MTPPRFTPVPLELFEDEQMDTIFYHNFPKAKGNNEIVLCNVLEKQCGNTFCYGQTYPFVTD